jgi:serine protease AprX
LNQVRLWIHGDDTGGLTGRGVGVAVLDTGCFPHEDFADRIVGFRDMVGRRAARPYDDNGHGTHVCGIIGGSGAAHLRNAAAAGDSEDPQSLNQLGMYHGIAPGCNLIPVKVLDHRGNGYASDVLAGLRYVREQREKWNIRIVNISVGSFSRRNMGEDSALVRGVNEAWDDGLVVVVAAGNMGPDRGTITTPGISRKVITVGCSDDEQEVCVRGSHMVNYSGRGPTGACVCKPDIVAPGAAITSCSNYPGAYTMKSGTSMSTPVVSGAIALLLEKYPGMSNRDVKLFLRARAKDLGMERNRQGWGLLDVKELLK